MKDDKYRRYEISLTDSNRNAAVVLAAIRRTPGIIWWNSSLWLIPAFIGLLITPFFYEFVIPFFENKPMSHSAFAFIDLWVFIFPARAALVSSVCCLVFSRIRDRILYRCAEQIVTEGPLEDERTGSTVSDRLIIKNTKWYYDICPNCGAAASNKDTNCVYCRSSLEASGYGVTDLKNVHKLVQAAFKQKLLP